MNTEETELQILSIDAWRYDNSWSWNFWSRSGTIEKEDFEKLKTNRDFINFFRNEGYIGENSKGKVSIEDDGYNIVICERSNNRPLYAIEYGPVYN